MTAARAAVVLSFALLTGGCWSNPSSQNGLDEPLTVQYLDPRGTNAKLSGQFVSGKLPGTAPLTKGEHVPDAGPNGPPQITSKNGFQTIFFEGQAAGSFTGQATANTTGIGIAVDGAGTGYWVVPPELGVDRNTGDLNWAVTVNLGTEIAPGSHVLRFVAIDSQGVAGPQTTLPLCIKSDVPDNLQECSPTRVPPKAVISLTWDTNVDLDLEVVTPDGTLVSPKHPFTTAALTDGGTVPSWAGTFDRDSDAGCIIDGIRTENLTWNTVAPHGRYLIYANLFSSCGQPAVRFVASVYTQVPNPDGGVPHLAEKVSQAGELLAVQANGGTALGLYVTTYTF